MEYFRLVDELVRVEDIEGFIKSLDAIDLLPLNNEEYFEFFTAIYSLLDKEEFKIALINKWNGTNFSRVSFITKIYGSTSLSVTDDLLRELAKLSNYTCSTMILEIITGNYKEPDTERILDRIYNLHCIGDEKFKELVQLHKDNIVDNDFLDKFFRRNLPDHTSIAKIPHKMIKKSRTVVPELDIDDVKSDYNNEELKSILTLIFVGFEITDKNDKVIDPVTTIIDKYNTNKSIHYIEPYVREYNLTIIRRDVHIFRLYGPLNALPGQTEGNDMLKGSTCYHVGGCRMFNCVHELINKHPEDEDFIYEGTEWFKGYCMRAECRKNILSYKHAVRFPIQGGTWIGCYCSWDCVVHSIQYISEVEVQQVNNNKLLMDHYGTYEE